MSTSVDLPTALFSEIQVRAAQQGQPVQAVVVDLLRRGLDTSQPPGGTAADVAALLDRRREIAGKFISGEWGAALEGFEAGRTADRDAAHRRSELWSE